MPVAGKACSWFLCTDILLEILSYAEPLKATAALMLTSGSVYAQLRGDKQLWKSLTNVYSCPVCVLEHDSLQNLFSVPEAEYWYSACRMAVAAKSIRSQWGIIFSSRAFTDISPARRPARHTGRGHAAAPALRPSHRLDMADAPREGLDADPPPKGSKSALARVSEYVVKKVSSVFSSPVEGRVYLTGQQTEHAEPHSEDEMPTNVSCNLSNGQLQVASFEETQAVLNRFMLLESGVLFSEDSLYLHKHEYEQTAGCQQTHIFRRKIGVEKRLRRVRHRPWQEVSVTPASNPRRLPVLAPFVGKDDGMKRDMRSLTTSMYYAVGAGTTAAAPVRWFFAKVLAIETSVRYREVLLAVCFSHALDPYAASTPIRGKQLQHKPNVARIVGVSRRTGGTFSWLSETNERGDAPPLAGANWGGGYRLRRV
jgi:hypothetical protein